jgi:hypothetical protein
VLLAFIDSDATGKGGNEFVLTDVSSMLNVLNSEIALLQVICHDLVLHYLEGAMNPSIICCDKK